MSTHFVINASTSQSSNEAAFKRQSCFMFAVCALGPLNDTPLAGSVAYCRCPGLYSFGYFVCLKVDMQVGDDARSF